MHSNAQCPHCGASISEGAVYCLSCSTHLIE
ncbi:zinc-ribbon domain-containing protein [Janthinobacterium sp. B9-8]